MNQQRGSAPHMRVIGLTGGSGSGKTTLCGILGEYGVKTLDTDLLSRAVTAPGSPCLSELIEHFGKEILHPDGTLNRRRLGETVFGEEDPEKRRQKQALLNRITHKYILAACNAWLARARQSGERLVVLDAPLLFESGLDRACDAVLGLTAQRSVRLARITARDGLSPAMAAARIDAQIDDETLFRRCDIVLQNNGTRDALAEAAKEALAALLETKPGGDK